MTQDSYISFWGDVKLNHADVVLSEDLQQLLEKCDYNVLNFEAPISSDGLAIRKSGPCISQAVQAADWVVKNGFNIVSLANNHAMDHGEAGLRKTFEALSAGAIIGAGDWDVAYKPLCVSLSNGKTIAIIAGTHTEFGTLIDEWDGSKYGCAAITHPEIVKAIIESKKNVDYVIVYAHAGVEYMDVPLPEWRTMYRHFIDLGADAVIASHPHVPQGYELYHNRYICYSLGNFCFQKEKHVSKKWWYNSICCILSFNANGIDLEMIPLVYKPSEKLVGICEDPNYIEHLKQISEVLSDKDLYLDQVNKDLQRLKGHYDAQFARSGYGWSVKGLLKGFYDSFKGLGAFSRVHVLNNLQCESHKWAITRLLKNKNVNG